MITVVWGAINHYRIKQKVEVKKWTVTFDNGEKLTGDLEHVNGDLYKISGTSPGGDSYLSFFDAKKVTRLTPEEPGTPLPPK